MSGPFAPGDVVCCVDNIPARTDKFGTAALHKLGKPYRVCWVGKSKWGRAVLRVDGVIYPAGSTGSYWSRFRKIDAADPAFTEAMRAIKPVRKTVQA